MSSKGLFSFNGTLSSCYCNHLVNMGVSWLKGDDEDEVDECH